MGTIIRRAVAGDCEKILKLLSEVEAIHQKGRPDIFRVNGTKFTEDELVRMFADDATPIFVADVDGEVMGLRVLRARGDKGQHDAARREDAPYRGRLRRPRTHAEPASAE